MSAGTLPLLVNMYLNLQKKEQHISCIVICVTYNIDAAEYSGEAVMDFAIVKILGSQSISSLHPDYFISCSL